MEIRDLRARRAISAPTSTGHERRRTIGKQLAHSAADRVCMNFTKPRRSLILGLPAIGVIALASLLHADARDDLGHAKSDSDTLHSRLNTATSDVNTYLAQSVALRALDKEQLETLIDQICKLDMRRDDDDPSQLARDMREKAVQRVRAAYDDTVRAGDHEKDDLDRFRADVQSLRDRVRSLQDQSDVKDDAGRLREDLETMLESIDRLKEKIDRDRGTLDRVRDGTMSGANNPLIRARMEYGKDEHKRLQSDRRCDESEVSLSSGRPDCIKFDPGDCKVIEFKPDSYSTSEAERQASKYLNDVRDRFKNDDRAKQCKQDADGPKFTAVGELYPRCRVP